MFYEEALEKMINFRMIPSTICVLAAVAAAQTPAPPARPASPERLAAPAPPARIVFLEEEAPVPPQRAFDESLTPATPPAPPAPAAVRDWETPPVPPAPAAYRDWQAPPAPPAPLVRDWETPTVPPAPAAYRDWQAPPAPPAPPVRDWETLPAPRPAPARVHGFAQRVAPPTPPARPAFAQLDSPPEPAPFPQARPVPVAPPAPPAPPEPFLYQPDQLDFNFDFDFQDKFDFQFDPQFKYDLKEKIADVKMNLDKLKDPAFNAKIKSAVDSAMWNAKIAADIGGKFAFAPQVAIRRLQDEERGYQAGLRALDERRFEEALEYFNQVAGRGGSRADGSWYWKAYTLNKLGKRDEALAAIAELRKLFASSRWLDDARALEVEVRQSANRPVTPESQSDEELKLLALNGLMNSDPDRALPLVETLLKSSQSPKIRKQAVYVLAQSNLPRAQQMLEQVARGGGNPDLQLSAIRYISERRKQNGPQILSEIYNSSSDYSVKRTILNGFQQYRDKDRLLQIAKTEKNQELRLEAIRMLRDVGGAQADLWQLYQSESTPEGKMQLLEMLPGPGNLERLVEVARTEKDPKIRQHAIHRLANERAAPVAGEALVTMYCAEQDQNVKRVIIDALSNQHNAKSLVAAAKCEKDDQMKRRVLERLVNIKSPEATEYLLEILKK
jgi:hypothetical protein